MEAFLHQQPQFSLLDSLCLSNSPIHQSGELSNASSSSTNAYNSPQEASAVSSFDDAMTLPKPHVTSSEKKRKQSENNGSCLATGQLQGARESKSRRKKVNGEEKKPKAKNNEEPPTEFIHVRARRGQATDSHSLAERVRRERISERMKKLQGLVPGCDKVIGKALILDEIINYVQSLQNQVEFLSMKIASANTIINFGVDFEDSMMQPEDMGSISQPIPSTIQNSHIPLTTFEGASNDLQVIDSHSSVFPLHGHLGSTAFSQDSSSFLMQVGDSRRWFPTQVELMNMFCYQKKNLDFIV